LNPSAQRGGPPPNGGSYVSSQYQQPPYNGGQNNNQNNNNGLGSRFSNYGYGNGGPGAQGGAHPLSHALYADSPSSPTLAGDPDDISDEKKGLQSFPPSSSSSSGGDSRSSNNRRINGAAGRTDRRGDDSALGNAYRRWSGAFIADSGVDDRHKKPERIGWLDGLRFFAAWVVINGTFFEATIGTSDVSGVLLQGRDRHPVPIVCSFSGVICSLLILLLFVITCSLPLLRSRRDTPLFNEAPLFTSSDLSVLVSLSSL
jgi:hypothetical protein